MANKSSPVRLSSGTRAVIIYNPRSGTHDIQASLSGALEVFREQGWQIDVQRTRQAGDVERYSVEARQAGYEVVLTAGGDGSLNEAANALAHSEVALGTLPSGTANVWARQIGLPMPAPLYTAHMADTARALCAGFIRPIGYSFSAIHAPFSILGNASGVVYSRRK